MTQHDSNRAAATHHASRAWASCSIGMVLLAASAVPALAGNMEEKTVAHIRLIPDHPWCPPFGLDRICRPMNVEVEIAFDTKPSTEFSLVGSLDGKEVARHTFSFTGKPPHVRRLLFDRWPSQLELFAATDARRAPTRVAQKPITSPAFEAEAVARPDTVVNPVDLGTILPPNDWLLLGPGQKPLLEVAAVSHFRDIPQTRWTAWFESRPKDKATATVDMPIGSPVKQSLSLPAPAADLERDALHVQITDADGGRLWDKKIPVMLVRNPPNWPKFGAVKARLRYDAPVSVRSDDGVYSTTSYQTLWKPELDDVVVALPNGSRYVFWRGSSYIPFWAGRHNTGLCYEWAETDPPKDGYTDCVEPLMDKELRYGRVQIMESTPARVHVRWSYQSCDFEYKVWGDSAVEDYFFYPDGFGTRVLTLQSRPTGDYELSELIILTPQSTYPFSILPRSLVDIIFLDGEKREIDFPFLHGEQGAKAKSRDMPAVYRVRLNNHEPLSGVYFNPLQRSLPPTFFQPFRDKGRLVTPTYWGSHWPLGQGKTTGWAIDDRIGHTPCHCSVMSWVRSRPEPLRTARLQTIDALGRSKPMVLQTWAWLIGMSDADDERLLEWAHSFSSPPGVEIEGGRLGFHAYVPERRAIRVRVEEPTVTIAVKPAKACVNPVFELLGAPEALTGISLAERQLESDEFAWDGKTLWLKADIASPTVVRLKFADASR